MSDYVEFSAKNTSEALSQAEKHFSLPISRLEVDILSTGSGGLLGMFSKKARIRVRPANAASVKDQVAQILNDGRSPARESKPLASPWLADDKIAIKEGDGIVTKEPAKEKKQPIAEEWAKENIQPVTEELPLSDNDEALNPQELISQAEEVVARLCRPLAATVELESLYEENQLTIAIKCAEPGVLIGRRAQILDALQYLAARIISHRFGRSIALVLDVEGYRARQLKQLEETVLKLAEKALAQGRPYTLGPLGTPERRLVHKVLKNKPLQTYSKGQGDLKRVVIAPLSGKC